MKFRVGQSRTLVVAGFIGACSFAAVFGALELLPQPREQAIVGFVQDADMGSLQLRFARHFEAAAVAVFSRVPTDIDGEYVPDALARVMVRNSNTVTLHPFENQRSGEYSIVVYIYQERCGLFTSQDYIRLDSLLTECGEGQFVELVRQPEQWLKKQFEFNRRFGYTILGRRTLLVAAPPQEELSELAFLGRPEVDIKRTPGVREDPLVLKHPELRKAGRIVQELWSKPISSGPTSTSYSRFMSEPFSRKIEMVRNGEHALMCQGMRDLFLHVSIGIGLKVRAVEAYNYSPQFPDLITYGHSTAEAWVSALGKWVIVDPWLGFVLATRGGTLLSAEDIKGGRKVAAKDVVVIPLVDRLLRVFHGKGGKATYQVSPKEVRMEGVVHAPTGYQPGYFLYFKTLEYKVPFIK